MSRWRQSFTVILQICIWIDMAKLSVNIAEIRLGISITSYLHCTKNWNHGGKFIGVFGAMFITCKFSVILEKKWFYSSSSGVEHFRYCATCESHFPLYQVIRSQFIALEQITIEIWWNISDELVFVSLRASAIFGTCDGDTDAWTSRSIYLLWSTSISLWNPSRANGNN